MFVAALISAGRGRLDDAARLVGAANVTRERLGRPPSRGIYARPFETLEQQLGRQRYVSAYSEGAATRSTTQSNSCRTLSRFQVTELVDNLDGFTSVTCERDIDWNGEPHLETART